jgi:sugar fermentation stimulation protein A
MDFLFETLPARFVARPNRFLVLAELESTGEQARVHCPDPGRLRELLIPGATLYISPASGSGRKTSHVLRFVEHPVGGQLVSLDTRLPNQLFAEELAAGIFAPFCMYTAFVREVSVPSLPSPLTAQRDVRSRIDYLLTGPALPACWVEVKSATLVDGRCAYFPDAVTERGRRHVRELAHLHATTGDRTAVVFIVQRPDVDAFAPHEERDPQFAAALRQAHAAGVEVLAYRCTLSREAMCLDRAIEVRL